MKYKSLSWALIENSKVSKRVSGEIDPVSYENIHTPNNHEKGKTHKEVAVSGLGDRPKEKKKIPQIQPPKKRERRSMKEDHGDGGPSSKPHMDGKSSAQTNRDESQAKPKAEKLSPTSKGRIEKQRDRLKKHKNADPGKPSELGKAYTDPIPVIPKKVQEQLDDLAALIGPFELRNDMIESYPDDFSDAAFDAHMGTDDSDRMGDQQSETQRDAVASFMQSQNASEELASYTKTSERDDRIALLYDLFDQAYGVVRSEVDHLGDAIDVDTDQLEYDFRKAIQTSGLPISQDELDVAMNEYQHPGWISDSKPRRGDALGENQGQGDINRKLRRNGIDRGFYDPKEMAFRLRKALRQRGFEEVGRQGHIHSFRKDDMQADLMIKPNTGFTGWAVHGRGIDIDGNDPEEFVRVLNTGGSGVFSLSRSGSSVTEMSSGGAVGSGAIATGGKSQLFASEEPELGIDRVELLQFLETILGNDTNPNRLMHAAEAAFNHFESQLPAIPKGQVLQKIVDVWEARGVEEEAPMQIDHIPHNPIHYEREVDTLLEPFGIDWATRPDDTDEMLIHKAINHGLTPKEFVSWLQDTYHLEPMGGNDDVMFGDQEVYDDIMNPKS